MKTKQINIYSPSNIFFCCKKFNLYCNFQGENFKYAYINNEGLKHKV